MEGYQSGAEEYNFSHEPTIQSSNLPTEVPADTRVDYDTNSECYHFQRQIFKKYSMHDIKINKQSNQSKAASVQDTIAIFEFSLKHNLSNHGIDELLRLFQDMHERNNVNIPLTNNHKTLWRRCSTGIISNSEADNGLFHILQWEYRLVQTVYANHPKPIFAHSYDIMEIISEELLNIDPTKFIRNPDIRFTDTTNERIFEDYTTGLHFKKLNDAVKSQNPNCTALCIGLTLDETQIRSGKRTFIPVYMYILNAIDDAFKMILLGYAPGDKLPYSNEDMENDLYQYSNGEKKGKKTIAGEMIKFHKQKFQRDYLYDVCKPILKTQENGVLLRVGSFNNEKGYEINACIHLCIISGDNAQLEFLSTTSFKNNSRKCRICMSKVCNSPDITEAIGKFRNDTKMQQLGKEYEDLLLERCRKIPGRRGNPNYKILGRKCQRKGIGAGDNTLIPLFKWQHDRGISGFFESLAPDYLHTIVKGFIEDAIAWTFCCLFSLRSHDVQYTDNMVYIDKRVINFPVIQSLALFPTKQPVRWNDGISHLFKNTWRRKAKKATTGFFANGSIEGWKLPQLLVQLLFCINKSICPFESKWSTMKGLKHPWNVGRTIVNSLTAVLYVHFCCRRKVLTNTQITNLSEVIENARTQLSLLRLMKQHLVVKNVKVDVVDSEYGGIKHHLALHIPHYKRFFGADGRTYDTELSEHAHKQLKVEFERTNKQYKQMLFEMLFNHRIRRHLQYVLSQMHSKKSSSHTVNTTADDAGYYCETVNTFGTPDRLIVKDNTVQVEQVRKFSNKVRNRFTTNPTKVTYQCKSKGINELLISYNEVMLLADRSDNVNFIDHWQKFKQGTLCCRLTKAVRCFFYKDQKSEHDFVVHCNSRFVRSSSNTVKKAKNLCDFIEVKYEDSNGEGSAMARLVAIFSFTDSEFNNEQIFFMIAWMKDAKKNLSVLPFPCYQYEIRNNLQHFQIIDFESMLKPAFLVLHSAETDMKWGDIGRTCIQHLKLQMFYCVPYELVVRDNIDGFVEYNGDHSSNNGLTQSHNIFEEMPAMLSKAQKNQVQKLLLELSNDEELPVNVGDYGSSDEGTDAGEDDDGDNDNNDSNSDSDDSDDSEDNG